MFGGRQASGQCGSSITHVAIAIAPPASTYPREGWLEQRRVAILPSDYLHIVSTLPNILNAIVMNNKKVMITILFKAASQAFLISSEKSLGGKLAFTATLYTWDQKLSGHSHQHCLVAGDAVLPNDSRLVLCDDNYLLNKRALSLLFRGKFMDRMKRPIGAERSRLTEPNL